MPIRIEVPDELAEDVINTAIIFCEPDSIFGRIAKLMETARAEQTSTGTDDDDANIDDNDISKSRYPCPPGNVYLGPVERPYTTFSGHIRVGGKCLPTCGGYGQHNY